MGFSIQITSNDGRTEEENYEDEAKVTWKKTGHSLVVICSQEWVISNDGC